MPVHFVIDPLVQIVAYVVEGDATPGEAREFFEAVIRHPDFEPGFDFLGDRRDVERVPGVSYIRAVADEVMAHQGELGRCKWAVIVSDDAAIGMVRMWGLMAELSGVEIEPFRSPQEATLWLGLPVSYAPLALVPAGE